MTATSRSLSLSCSLKQAPFIVEQKLPAYEVRRYQSVVIAETDYEQHDSNDSKGQSAAFRRLAKYIGVFGTPENAKSGGTEAIAMTAPVLTSEVKTEAIAMTAPVLTSAGEEATTKTMAFVMPKHFTIESIPKPTNSAVRVRENAEQLTAVVTFSGTASDAAAVKQAEALIAAVGADGLAVDSTKAATGERVWQLAQFNPPWTIPFLRTNEIILPITDRKTEACPSKL
jgi:hypothetical protein